MRSKNHAAGLLLAAAAAGSLFSVAAQATDIFTGTFSLDASDPTQLGRLSRSSIPSDWSEPKAFPGIINPTTTYHYATFDIDLSALESGYTYGSFIQFTVNNPSTTVFMSAYNGSYSPTDPAANYIGDEGNSGNYFGTDPRVFQIVIPQSEHLVLVLNESTTNGGLDMPDNVLIEAFSDTEYTNLAPAVPEPGTWVLMALGAALLAGVGLRRKRAGRKLLAVATVAAMGATAAHAQGVADTDSIDAQGETQIASLLKEKATRSAVDQKMASALWYALQSSRGLEMKGFTQLYRHAVAAVGADSAGRVKVSIKGVVSDGLLNRIVALGGTVHYSSAKRGGILASVPLTQMESLAIYPDVAHIAMAPRAHTNVGSVTSQGYISHSANVEVMAGIDGTGVNVGVLSDSVEALQSLIATGDLPPDVTVVPGQDGSGLGGESEGTAMMEIIHDLAPGAKLFFATAFNSEDSFADNIRTLRDTYHCDIIVDDVSYFDEGAFQDSEVAQAVNDVTAEGALYFSAAANSGNLTSGTSGTWEGDFNGRRRSKSPLPAGYTLNAFSGLKTYDELTVATNFIDIQWSDPLNASTNDYDLFLLDSTGATVLCASIDVQNGSTSPYESCYAGDGLTWPVDTRIVIAKHSSAAKRALHLDTERGEVAIGTSGATFGHNAAAATVTTAATYWNSAGTGSKPFVGGAANPIETFSSDGPRKIFYQPDGTPITPGNYLFSTNGGDTLSKPDVTAADGVVTKTPGFNPFFGTSAAGPHAAAIAALVKQARPDYTNTLILNAMKATTLDIEATGIDRDSGSGIVMAPGAVSYAKTH